MDGTTGVIEQDLITRDEVIAAFAPVKLTERAFDSPLSPAELSHSQSGLPVFWQANGPAVPEMTAQRRLSLAVKRACDVIGASLGLFALAPLLVITAVCIKMTDRGPVFFRQARVGQNGKSFAIFKFRSMYWDRCDISGVAQTVSNDHRVTPIGAFIRKTSIDELPQLINVLSGDMSLVGPRPHVRGMLAAGKPYEELAPHYDFRHSMRPGLTGWAQCNGLRGPTVERSKALRRIGHDIAYVQNFSLWLDLRILVKTITSELLSSTAH